MCVPLDEYLAWKKPELQEVFPKTFCGGAYGRDVVTLNEEDILNTDTPLDPEKHYYVNCTTPVTYVDCCGEFLSETMPRLKEIDPDPKNVRIVFWFDN
jgi:hypothetical protein